VDWINIYEEGELGKKGDFKDSKLALKFSVLGFFLFLATPIGLALANNSEELEGVNKYNKKAKIIGITAAVVNISVLFLLTFTSLSTFGLSL